MSSPRVKTVLMSQVEKKEPAIKHRRLEEELTPKEIMEIRQDTWNVAAKHATSFSRCFHLGVRPDVGTIGDNRIVNTFMAEQLALWQDQLPLWMLQKK